MHERVPAVRSVQGQERFKYLSEVRLPSTRQDGREARQSRGNPGFSYVDDGGKRKEMTREGDARAAVNIDFCGNTHGSSVDTVAWAGLS